jgi:endo-1,4-beta-xylanase
MRVPRAAVATALAAVPLSCSVPAAFASQERAHSDSLAALAARHHGLRIGTAVDTDVPGFFTGQGGACLYDENLQPKPAYFALRDLLAA